MDANAARPEPVATPLFQAIVKPHRSLSRKGLVALICCLLLGSLIITSLMALLGAWPVIGFNGADIALSLFLIRLNLRASRTVEIISLGENELEISRTDQRGRRELLTLRPYWLNVVREELQGSVPQLYLSSHGTHTEIAATLGEAQKRDLAAALATAVRRWRNPSFDNPQLRE
jgi:uncharacterized membrane protein